MPQQQASECLTKERHTITVKEKLICRCTLAYERTDSALYVTCS